jgi:hypothetical protein
MHKFILQLIRISRLLLASCLCLVICQMCTVDKGIQPIRSAIKGEITFSGDWPKSPFEVRLAAATDYPPATFDELILGEPIPADVASYEYTFYLKPNRYKIVGVAWRAEGSTWTLSSICGLYFTETDSLLPGEVNIPSDRAFVENINITIDRSQARDASKQEITGKATFQGAWPDSFKNAVVVASIKDISLESITFYDLYFGNTFAKGTVTSDYHIYVTPGTYRALAVLFFHQDRPFSLDDLYYSQSVGGVVIEDLTVAENESKTGPDFDLQIGPKNSGLAGTITFTGDWPETAEEVRIIAAATFPPEMNELIIGESVPVTSDKYQYLFNLDPATYRLVGVVWRPQGANWDLLSICGFYFSGGDSLAPGEVIIPDGNTVVNNINIGVNRSRARKISDTKIVGSITFNGAWPSDIIEARVIASTRFSLAQPIELPTLLDLGFSDVIPVGTGEIDYVINAFPARFVATGIIFFKEGKRLELTDIVYSSQVGGLDLTPYDVVEDSTFIGPDFTISF